MKEIIIALFIIMLSNTNCTSKKKKYPTQEEIKTAFNAVLDSAITPTYTKIRYDIRGTFNFEYDDSLIFGSLEYADSIIEKDDLDFIIEQYNLLKGKEIDNYIIKGKYSIKEGARYKPEDSIDYQFYLSPPLFTRDKKFFVTFCIGSAIRPKSFKDGFYFIFIKEDGKWNLFSIIKNNFTTPEQVNAGQSHSYVPIG